MFNISTKKLDIEENLKQRIMFICEFCHVKPQIINGNLHRIDKTNLSYVEPHKIIIKNKTFLIFNYSTDVYINNLTNKIKLVELENYIKNMS